jgi:hypothetical protein
LVSHGEPPLRAPQPSPAFLAAPIVGMSFSLGLHEFTEEWGFGIQESGFGRRSCPALNPES